MENKKLGGGIITISVLYLVFLSLGIIGSFISLATLDAINSIAVQSGLPEITSTELIISIVISLILLISIILILFKKKVGIYGFFTTVVINIIYSLVMNGFDATNLVSTLISLILPTLLAIFIYQKREVFGFEIKENTLDA